MNQAAYEIVDRDGEARLRLTGDWTTTALGRTPRRLDRDLDGRSIGAVDITALGRFDTAGALALVKAANGGVPKEVWEARPEAGRIYRMIEALERKSVPPPRRTDARYHSAFACALTRPVAATPSSISFVKPRTLP